MASSYRNNRFQEYFEESEVDQSEIEIQYNLPQNGEPIQLVKVRPGGKVELDPIALSIIANCQQPVGFASLVGKYRTGKSFLLNKLLSLQKKVPSVVFHESMHRGYLDVVEAILQQQTPKLYISSGYHDNYLDTEGADSLTKDPHHDSIIFILACLISSYLIYNSVGNIDEKSIGELNLITTLANNIIIEDRISPKQNQQHLFNFMPKFLWILRDFTLELKDERGHRITANEYLENSLGDQNSLIRGNEDVRRVRRSLLTYFKQRECMILVRPAKQQRDLQNLDALPDHALRKQFLEGINILRQKIMKNAAAKTHQGNPLYGTAIVAMLESYVDSINRGNIPNIKTAWEHIADNEGASAYNCAIEKYKQIIEKAIPDDRPKDEIQLVEILGRLRDETIREFHSNMSEPNEDYHTKLKEFLTEKEKQLIEINKELNLNRNEEILIDCSQKLLLSIESRYYVGKDDDFNRDLAKVQNDYNSKAKGANKGDILAKFLTKVYPIFYDQQKSSIKPSNQQKVSQDLKAKQLKILEQKNIQLQNQINKIVKQNTKLPKGGKDVGKKEDKQSDTCCLIF